MAVDLRKCCSEDDLSTAIPFILLSPSLFFFIPLAKCESHLRSKTWLAHDIITVAQHFSRVLYYIVNFQIVALDK